MSPAKSRRPSTEDLAVPGIPKNPPGPVPEPVHPSRPCTEFQYAVKLVQGAAPVLSDLSVIVPGRYFTAINVHNPSTCKTVTFRWKVALADVDGRHVSIISAFQNATLRPDEALEIDAPLIARVVSHGTTRFLKGFVVLESPCELDVVAVYTGSPAGQGPASPPALDLAFHTERVPARKIESCLDLNLNISTGVADWMLMSAPPMPSANAPCQAAVLPAANQLSIWTSQPGSLWISASGAVTSGPVFPPGWYVFQYCFTLCSGFTNPALNMKVLVDDQAWIRLNGAWVGTPYSFGSPHVPGNFGGPPLTVPTITSGFLPGRNCLELVVYNTVNPHPVNPVGVNVLGTLIAERGACREECGCC